MIIFIQNNLQTRRPVAEETQRRHLERETHCLPLTFYERKSGNILITK
jgi:hypothetical protein